MPGQVQLLMGEDLTRPEVDNEKIGCAGHWGEGTLTKFISAIDERVKCVVVNQGGARNGWPSRYSPWSRLGPFAGTTGVRQMALHPALQCRWPSSCLTSENLDS